jgi:hypothetical protein
MQIIPGNALTHTVSGSAPAGGSNRTQPDAQAAIHGKTQAAGAARPGQPPAGGNVVRAQGSQHVERPLPSEARPNMPPGSIIDIRV